jgi:Holliday junction resolvasome RuvABC ATP-dependent DNA helicase subunit
VSGTNAGHLTVVWGVMFDNYPVMGERSRRLMVDRRLNPNSLFNQIVGQDGAVDALADAVYEGLGNHSRLVAKRHMLVGPPSTAKSSIVRDVVAPILNVPTVFVDASEVKKPQALVDAIFMVWAKQGVMLEPNRDYQGWKLIELPAMIVMIDEIHNLPSATQEGMLKATERSDGMLFADGYVLDCRKVWWIGATTDWGKLIRAFRTRWRRVDLFPPTVAEVEQMVQKKGWDAALACQFVKYGGTVPREVFDFIDACRDCAKRNSVDVGAAIDVVRRREQIDDYGLRIQRLKVLLALKSAGDRGCLLRTLVMATGCQQEELLGHWLPPMITAPPGQVPMVMFDGRYYLTATGMSELRKRGL